MFRQHGTPPLLVKGRRGDMHNSRYGIVTVGITPVYISHCQLPDMVWSLQQVEV